MIINKISNQLKFYNLIMLQQQILSDHFVGDGYTPETVTVALATMII